MNRPPGEVHVCHVIHALGPGGAEQSLLELAAAGPSAGLRTSVLCLTGDGRPYAQRLRDAGARVAVLGGRTRWDPTLLPRAVAAVGASGADVVHSHLKHADLVGALAATRYDLPLVSSLHLIEDGVGPGGRARRWLGHQARRHRADRVVAVSDAVRSWYRATFDVEDDRVVTVRNGVAPGESATPQRRRATRAALGLGDTDVVAVMVGVMRPGKGHAELLEAARLLGGDGGVRFVLLGDGPLRPALEQRARQLALDVVFAGFRPDVRQVLAGADLVVHPTLFDALPTALIEALAAGLPVVASDVGGVPEIVDGTCGVLVPAGDPRSLADAVRALATDEAARARAGQAARRRFDAEFTAEGWARRLRETYDAVLSGGGSAAVPGGEDA